MEKNVLKLEEYSKRSIVVRGDKDPTATKLFINELKNMGGKLNYRLKEKNDPNSYYVGYIFSKNKYDEVNRFVENVNNGEINGVKPLPRDKTIQTIRWCVKRPKVGQVMNLHINGKTYPYKVRSLEGNKAVKRIYAEPFSGDKQVKVIIADGKWTIWGIFDEHEISFQDQLPIDENSVEVPDNLEEIHIPVAN